MQTLLLIAVLALVQEPPLQIPPPPAEAPVQVQTSAPASAPAPAARPTPAPAQTPAPIATPSPSAAPLSFFSENFPYAWDRIIPLTINLDGLKVSSIFFNKRVVERGMFGLFKDAEFGSRAQVEVTNTGKFPKVPGFAVAVLDKDGRLVGVASGGTKFGTIKPGETETFDLNFTQVKERLESGDKFFLAIELRN